MLSLARLALTLQRSRSGAGGVDWSPLALFASGEEGAIWDFLDPSIFFQERTGASATTTAGVGDPVGTVLDSSGNGFHLIAPSDSARPILRLTGGLYRLELNGSGHGMAATTSGLSLSCTLAEAFTPGADTLYALHQHNQLTSIFLYAQLGSTSPVSYGTSTGTPTYRLNGSSISFANRGEVYSAFVGQTNLLLAESLDLSSWTNFGLNAYAANSMAGDWYGGVLVDRALTAGERGKLEAWVAARCGVSL